MVIIFVIYGARGQVIRELGQNMLIFEAFQGSQVSTILNNYSKILKNIIIELLQLYKQYGSKIVYMILTIV